MTVNMDPLSSILSTTALPDFNETDNSSAPALQTGLLASYAGYGILGMVTLTVNIFVIATICGTKEMRRREMYPLVGLALGDGTFGTAFVLAFFRRVYLIFTHQAMVLTTPWNCMTVVHTYFFMSGSIHATLMLVVVSLDRLCAVVRPIAYSNLGMHYAAVIMIAPWSYAQLLFIIGLGISWNMPRDSIVLNLCYSESGVSEEFYLGITLQMMIFAFLSVVIYASVMLIFRRQIAKSAAANSLQSFHLKRQAKVTKMVSIIALSTLLLFLIPSLINGFKVYYPQYTAYIVPFTSVLQISNSTVNFFVYVSYNRSFRTAFVRTCCPCCARHKPRSGSVVKSMTFSGYTNYRALPMSSRAENTVV